MAPRVSFLALCARGCCDETSALLVIDADFGQPKAWLGLMVHSPTPVLCCLWRDRRARYLGRAQQQARVWRARPRAREVPGYIERPRAWTPSEQRGGRAKLSEGERPSEGGRSLSVREAHAQVLCPPTDIAPPARPSVL